MDASVLCFAAAAAADSPCICVCVCVCEPNLLSADSVVRPRSVRSCDPEL